MEPMQRAAIRSGLLVALALALAAVSAPALAVDSLPEPQRTGDVVYLTGGVSDQEQAAIKERLDDYKLVVTLAKANGAYLANVRVVLEGANGEPVLETTTRGPFLLADVPKGHYTLRAQLEGHESAQRVLDVPEEGSVRMYVVLPEQDEEAG